MRTLDNCRAWATFGWELDIWLKVDQSIWELQALPLSSSLEIAMGLQSR